MKDGDPVAIEGECFFEDRCLSFGIEFHLRRHEVHCIQDDFDGSGVNIPEEAVHHFRGVERMIKDALHTDDNAELFRSADDLFERFQHGLITFLSPGEGSYLEICREPPGLRADHVRSDPFCVTKMLDKAGNSRFAGFLIGVRGIDIAAEDCDMDVPLPELAADVAGKTGTVVTGTEIIVRDGFPEGELNVPDVVRPDCVEDFRERELRAQVVCAHAVLNHMSLL